MADTVGDVTREELQRAMAGEQAKKSALEAKPTGRRSASAGSSTMMSGTLRAGGFWTMRRPTLYTSYLLLRHDCEGAPNDLRMAVLHLLTADLEDSVYRSAFDVAVAHLGDDAMLHFVHVANLSLYTTEPQAVFAPLLEEFAARASKLNLASNHRIGTELLGRRFPGMILGTAESLINTGMEHPALVHIAAEVANHARMKIGDYARLYAGDFDPEIADLLQTTTYFPVNADGRIPMATSRSDLLVDVGGLRHVNASIPQCGERHLDAPS